ncbi:MAG: GlsB/YeaQ/YmgE family stress response membrane protein [Bacilli bacterium]|nr:GlsB/YeaQ/YmgE family stress response membrane protein [Bacilli bacterium]
MSVSEIVMAILIGGIAGWLATIVMKTKGNIVKYIVLGILGGFVGGYLFGLLNLSISLSVGPINFGTVIVSAIGACIVIFLVDKLLK